MNRLAALRLIAIAMAIPFCRALPIDPSNSQSLWHLMMGQHTSRM